MDNTFHAVLAIRELTQLHEIDFNINGHFELIFDEDTAVNFYQIDNQTIELCTLLPNGTQMLTADAYMRLLTANYLGHGTGGGRLALDPRDHSLLVCERLDVAGLDARMLQARLERFIAHAKMWLSGEMDEFLRGQAGSSLTSGGDETHIRG